MIVKAILIVAEGIFLSAFLITMFMGIVCTGNIVGTAVFTALMLATVFSGEVKAFIAGLMRTAAGKIAVIFVSVIVAAGVIWCVVLSAMMIRSALSKPEKCDVIIVLGCKVNSSGPSRMLRRRLDAAYEFLVENPGVICVVSGGQGANEPESEGEVMKRYLVSKGVSEDRIFVENRSADTYENIKFSVEILDELGISHENVAIVTDAFHQCRAQMIAKKQGVETSAVSAWTEPVFVPTYWVREWFALTEEILLK